MKRYFVLLPVLMVALSGCAKKADVEAERAALRQADADWAKTIAAKDAERHQASQHTVRQRNGCHSHVGNHANGAARIRRKLGTHVGGSGRVGGYRIHTGKLHVSDDDAGRQSGD